MQLEETIRDIRQQCRMAMNGMASASMRERGLVYKLNFGLVIQQIKDLADRYESSIELAESLWKEETRELKILATFLFPKDKFTAEYANKWALEIGNQEIREQLCLNLLQELDFADQLAIAWANSEDKELRTTGYWLLARLFLTKKIQSHLVVDYFNYIWQDAVAEDLFLRNAALLDLKFIGRQSREEADIILQQLSVYREDSDPIKQEAYNSTAFEFEYFFGE